MFAPVFFSFFFQQMVTVTNRGANIARGESGGQVEKARVSFLANRTMMKRLTVSRYDKSRNIGWIILPSSQCTMHRITTAVSLSFYLCFCRLAILPLFRVPSHVLVINIKVPWRANGVRIADSNAAAASSRGRREGEGESGLCEGGVDRAPVYYLAGLQPAARLASVLSS